MIKLNKMAYVYILYWEKLNNTKLAVPFTTMQIWCWKTSRKLLWVKVIYSKEWQLVGCFASRSRITGACDENRKEDKIHEKSSVFIKNLMKYSELRDKIIENTQE